MAKRKSFTFPKWGAKRRRTGGRTSRFKRRGRVATSYTSQKAGTNNTKYRTRKVPTRRWRNLLWTSTLQKAHYRSAGNTTTTLSTSATQGLGLVQVIQPLFIGVPGPTTAFYTAAGGLQQLDAGVTPGSFNSDVILRGGRIGLTFVAPEEITDDIGVTMYTVWTAKNADFTKVPATITWGSNLDSGSDFAEFGKILFKQEYIINNRYPAVQVERRLKVQKIDQDSFEEGGQQIVYVAVLTNLVASTARALAFIVHHDVSFSGDQE